MSHKIFCITYNRCQKNIACIMYNGKCNHCIFNGEYNIKVGYKGKLVRIWCIALPTDGTLWSHLTTNVILRQPVLTACCCCLGLWLVIL